MWDVTCTDTLCASNQHRSISEPGNAAAHAEALKTSKYAQLGSSYQFIPIAVEMLGPFGPQAQDFFRRQLRVATDLLSSSSKGSLSPFKETMLCQCWALSSHHGDQTRLNASLSSREAANFCMSLYDCCLSSLLLLLLLLLILYNNDTMMMTKCY